MICAALRRRLKTVFGPAAYGSVLIAFLAAVQLSLASAAPLKPPKGGGRINIMMVWDGLLPDLVNGHDTPQLASMMENGARLARHHSVYPTMPMVEAAVLATGTGPGGPGIFG